MYYVMKLHGTCATRHGRMFKRSMSAIRLAQRLGPSAYVEQYGSGVVWTPKASRL